MNYCSCGAELTGQRRVCDICKREHKLAHNRMYRQHVRLLKNASRNRVSDQQPIGNIQKPARKFKKLMLINPLTDSMQMEIDERAEFADVRRMNIDPVDPRVISVTRPVLWLWGF